MRFLRNAPVKFLRLPFNNGFRFSGTNNNDHFFLDIISVINNPNYCDADKTAEVRRCLTRIIDQPLNPSQQELLKGAAFSPYIDALFTLAIENEHNAILEALLDNERIRSRLSLNQNAEITSAIEVAASCLNSKALTILAKRFPEVVNREPFQDIQSPFIRAAVSTKSTNQIITTYHCLLQWGFYSGPEVRDVLLSFFNMSKSRAEQQKFAALIKILKFKVKENTSQYEIKNPDILPKKSQQTEKNSFFDTFSPYKALILGSVAYGYFTNINDLQNNAYGFSNFITGFCIILFGSLIYGVGAVAGLAGGTLFEAVTESWGGVPPGTCSSASSTLGRILSAPIMFLGASYVGAGLADLHRIIKRDNNSRSSTQPPKENDEGLSAKIPS